MNKTNIENFYFVGLSIAIGIYQGCYRSKQLTTSEFLIADGRMKVNSETKKKR